MSTIQNDSKKVNLRFFINKITTWPFITLMIFFDITKSDKKAFKRN